MSEQITTEELEEEAQIRNEIGEHRVAISNLIDRLEEIMQARCTGKNYAEVQASE